MFFDYQEVALKNRWLLGTLMLIAATLACNFPFQEEIKYTWPTIMDVVVSPPSGKEDFTLEVTYQVFWIPDKQIANIECQYSAPDGTSESIGTIDMFRHIGMRSVETFTEILPFFIAQKNGMINGGIYLATCTTENDMSTLTTTFEVIGDDTPTPTATSAPASATPTTQPQALTLKGRIIFNYNGYQSSRPSGAGELKIPTENCIPEVTITPDGVVSGTCEYTGPTPIRTNTTTIAQITGNAVQGGSFNFTYEVTEKWPNGWCDTAGTPADVNVWSCEQIRHIIYTDTGTGKFTSATEASGVANFDFSCDTGADNLIHCWKWSKESFSGTMPWSFVPSQ